MWSYYCPFHFPFSHKVKSAQVGVVLEKAHTHLEPWNGGESLRSARWGSRLRSACLGASLALPGLPTPRRMVEKGPLGAQGEGEAAAPGARLSERSTPPCPDTPSSSWLPLTPLRRRKPALLLQLHPGPPRAPPSEQPMESQGASGATRQAANWGGPLGGQPSGIGQQPAAPAQARLLFVRAAPISPGPHPKADSQASRS